MECFWIALGKQITPDEVAGALKSKYRNSVVEYCTLENKHKALLNLNASSVRDIDSIILFEHADSESDFPVVVNFHTFKVEENDARTDLTTAKHLSETLNTSVLLDISEYEPEGPYWCVIFEEGKVYLGDDRDSAFFDGGEKPIGRVGEISLDSIQK